MFINTYFIIRNILYFKSKKHKNEIDTDLVLGCFNKTELTELGKLGKTTQFYLENLVFCLVLSLLSSVNSVLSNAHGSVRRPPLSLML